MAGQFFNVLVLSMVLVLAGCQQVQSRLATDVKALIEAISTHESPVATEVAKSPSQPVEAIDKPKTPSVEASPDASEPMGSFKDCAFCPEMLALSSGQVQMGSLPSEKGRQSDETPVQNIPVKAFAMGKYEVTKAQWRVFVEKTAYQTSSDCLTWDGDGYAKPAQLSWQQPGFIQTDEHPVVCVNWRDAQAYTQWLSQVSGKHYRLPSEAEWEYAGKAGQGLVPFSWNPSEPVCAHANLADQTLTQSHPQWVVVSCSDGFAYTAPAGSFSSNPWGIFDMQGNVMEWVSSCYSSSLSSQPVEGSACSKRVIKGGGWDMSEKLLRNAYRGRAGEFNMSTGLGFRVARDNF